MFEKNYELRYSDMNRKGRIKKSAVIDLLQDVSIIHSNSVGLDGKKYAELKIACLLANWRIRFLEELTPYETVTVKTGIMKLTRCETYRKYEIWQNGVCKVIATGLWFTVNTETMRISRDTEKIFSVFECVTEEDNNLVCDKLRPLENTVFIGETIVEKRDLDTNNHLNNVKSVEVVLNRIPDDFEFTEIQVKYRKELKSGEVIKLYASEDNFGYELKNSEDETCVLVYVKK